MDEREAISAIFFEDEYFIKTQEFKDFWIQMKRKYFEELKRLKLMWIEESRHEEVI